MDTTMALEQGLELILQLAAIVVGLAIAWATKTAKDKWGLDIEEKHRVVMHTALMTGARAALERLMPDSPAGTSTPAGFLSRSQVNAVKKEAIDYAHRSGPDAIRFFSPLPDVLDNLAISAVQKVLAERLARR